MFWIFALVKQFWRPYEIELLKVIDVKDNVWYFVIHLKIIHMYLVPDFYGQYCVFD